MAYYNYNNNYNNNYQYNTASCNTSFNNCYNPTCNPCTNYLLTGGAWASSQNVKSITIQPYGWSGSINWSESSGGRCGTLMNCSTNSSPCRLSCATFTVIVVLYSGCTYHFTVSMNLPYAVNCSSTKATNSSSGCGLLTTTITQNTNNSYTLTLYYA